MVYSEVVRRGLILPLKSKYTLADVNRVMVGSLFTPGGTFSREEAVCIVKCSALFHRTDCSKAVASASV